MFRFSFVAGFGRFMVLCCWWGFAGGQDPAHDWRVEFVSAVPHAAIVFFCTKRECSKIAFFFKILPPQSYRQYTRKIALTICSLIAMFAHIPGKYPGLAKVIGQAFFFREQYQ